MSDAEPIWRPSQTDRRFDVLGIGENSLDRVCVVDTMPKSGEKQTVAESHELPGGQVATAIRTCARLGLRCSYAGAVGGDAAATRVLEPLRKAQVHLDGVQRIEAATTRSAVVLVEREGAERTVLGHRDPLLAIRTEALQRSEIADAHVLEIDTSDPDVALWACRVARDAGTAVVLDADWASPQVLECLAYVDFPIVSCGFAESLGQGGAPDRALRELAARGAKMSVVTLGHRGSIAQIGDRTIESPAFSIRAIDTTGAGDAFRGGFIWALVNRWDPVTALRAANASAAMNCRALGAQGGLPSRAELEEFLAERDIGGDR